MKKLSLISLALLFSCLFSCGDNSKTITVGASPTPHYTILNSDIVKNYIESKGYKLNVIVYQDYVTPNKALNDGGIDANYFQHTPYLLEEVSNKNYDIAPACEVHYEPLNVYSKKSYLQILFEWYKWKHDAWAVREILRGYICLTCPNDFTITRVIHDSTVYEIGLNIWWLKG